MAENETPIGDQTCPSVGYQTVSVCVPVTVTPFAHTNPTSTHCCGDAIVTSGNTPCPGSRNGTCSFTISQTLCVEVPVEFGASASVGDTYVNCIGASSEDCTDCHGVDSTDSTDNSGGSGSGGTTS